MVEAQSVQTVWLLLEYLENCTLGASERWHIDAGGVSDV